MDKEAIKTEIKAWQTTHGDNTPEYVMENLPEIFNMLLEKGLVGVEYEDVFHESAKNSYILHKIGGIFG